MDYVNEFLSKHKRIETVKRPGFEYTYRPLAPKMQLADGTKMSVQVSRTHYCEPREDDAQLYTEVEVGYPSREIPEIMDWCENPESPMDTVYGFVPVDVLNRVIEAAGGVA